MSTQDISEILIRRVEQARAILRETEKFYEGLGTNKQAISNMIRTSATAEDRAEAQTQFNSIIQEIDRKVHSEFHQGSAAAPPSLTDSDEIRPVRRPRQMI